MKHQFASAVSEVRFEQVAEPVASVVVVGFGSAPHLIGCLRLLAEAGEETPFEVIVVANSLAEQTAGRLAASVHGATVLTTRVNRGFAGACNLGAERAGGKYLMFLNDDTAPTPGWLDRLVETAEETGAGAVGSRMLNADGTLQEAGSVVWSNGATSSVGRGLDGDGPDYRHRRKVDYCSASSLLVRRKTFEAVGGMDERYFPAYYEDVDLCLRIKERGADILYEPESVVRHIESESSTLRFKVFLLLKHRERFVERWREELATKLPPAPLDRDAVQLAVLAAQNDDRATRPAPEVAPQVHLDQPPADELPREVVRIAGWALFDSSIASRCEISVNGEPSGRATSGLQRPDVAATVPSPAALISGFEHLVDLAVLPSDTAEVHVVARAVGPQPQAASVMTERRFNLSLSTDEQPDEEVTSERSRRQVLLTKAVPAQRPATMNLAVFAHGLGYGGAELWLSEWLMRSGAGSQFDCTVISPEDGPLRDELETRGIEVHISPDEWRSAAAYERRITELAGFLAARGHDAVLANTALALAGADAGLAAGRLVIWALHESWHPRELWPMFFEPGYVARGIRQRLEEVLSSVQALVFPAEATRHFYANLTHPGRALVIPYGIDTAAIDHYMAKTSRAAARATLGLRDHDRVLLVVGIAQPRKCQTLIAEAFADVASEDPTVRLLIVGTRDDPYGRAVRDVTRKSGLGLRLEAVPLTPDTSLYYRAADVLISASIVEGLPRTMLEAMCFGLPVVAAAAHGVPELLREGQDGWLFEPGDVDALRTALRRVLSEEPQRLAEMGERGRSRVMARFDSKDYAEDLRVLLEGLRNDSSALPKDILAAAGRSPGDRLAATPAPPPSRPVPEVQPTETITGAEDFEKDLVFMRRDLETKAEYIRALEAGLDDDLTRARDEVVRLTAELGRVSAELEAVRSRTLYRTTERAVATFVRHETPYRLARAILEGFRRIGNRKARSMRKRQQVDEEATT